MLKRELDGVVVDMQYKLAEDSDYLFENFAVAAIGAEQQYCIECGCAGQGGIIGYSLIE